MANPISFFKKKVLENPKKQMVGTSIICEWCFDVKCSFCSKELPKGKGMIFVQPTGKTFYFCSKKCEKNLLKLGRDPRKFKWANA